MAIAKEKQFGKLNMHSKNIVSRFSGLLCFCEIYLDAKKKIEFYYFCVSFHTNSAITYI